MLFCGRVEQSEPKIRNENPREHPTRRHLPPKKTWIDPRPMKQQQPLMIKTIINENNQKRTPLKAPDVSPHPGPK